MLWVTEGQKKGDSLASCGAAAVALLGVDNWHGVDWRDIPLKGRDIAIVFDSDATTKADVQRALTTLTVYLTNKGATVRHAYWPGSPAAKQGVDDFLRTHTLQDLEALLTVPRSFSSSGHQPPTSPPPPPPAADPAATLGTVSPCTHTANARRLVRLYTPTLRYVLGEGWILWTGKFWRPDPTSDNALATGFVSQLARSIADEAAALYSAAAVCADDSERKALYALAEARGQWAAQSENATTIAGGLKIAKHDFLLEHGAINTNPWLFNCDSGTIDLQTGVIRAHDPADLITHIATVSYDPSATCPVWNTFLDEVFEGDAELLDFMQKGIGSCLTGVVRDRALFFLYGEGGHNGKTTLVEAIRDVLGTAGEESFGYARKVDIATFMRSKNYDDNLRKMVQLVGTRFVYSSEIGDDHRLNEQLLKDMTGGDTVEARRLYREAFTFKPTFKPWMYGNHKPEIRGTDDALWSRVKLVPFNVSFADRVDTGLPDKLRKELPGILNWALKGCLAWQRDGLPIPTKVRTATATYRIEQDTIGQFLLERCQTGDEHLQCRATVLYTAYRSWAEHTDHPRVSQTRFGSYLTAHGYPSDNNATGRGHYRIGIALLTPPTSDSGAERLDTNPPEWENLSRTPPFGGCDCPDTSPLATGGGLATPCDKPAASPIASNDAENPLSEGRIATGTKSISGKSPIENLHEGLPGKGGRRGSNDATQDNTLVENQRDVGATCLDERGSTPASRGSRGSRGSSQAETAHPPKGGVTSPGEESTGAGEGTQNAEKHHSDAGSDFAIVQTLHIPETDAETANPPSGGLTSDGALAGYAQNAEKQNFGAEGNFAIVQTLHSPETAGETAHPPKGGVTPDGGAMLIGESTGTGEGAQNADFAIVQTLHIPETDAETANPPKGGLTSNGDAMVVGEASAHVADLPTAAEADLPLVYEGSLAPPYTYIRHAAELLGVLETLRACPRLGMDFECTGLDWRTDQLRLMQFSNGEHAWLIDAFTCPLSALKPLLASETLFVGHNLKFELHWLSKAGLPIPTHLRDTWILEHLLVACGGGKQPRCGLGDVAERHLGETLDKRFQKADWSGVLTDGHLQYAAKDAQVVLPILDIQKQRITEAGLTDVAILEHTCLPAMVWLEEPGVPINVAPWLKLAEKAASETRRLEASMQAIVDASGYAKPVPYTKTGKVPKGFDPRVNWNSDKQVLALLEARGLSADSRARDALKMLKTDDPIVTQYIERSLWFARIKWGAQWVDDYVRDGRVYANFIQMGSSAGRMSCKDPNLQNIPRADEYRACFQAPEASCLVKVDYGQVELRIVAIIAKDSAMLAALNRGEDLHKKTAAQVRGCDPSAVSKKDRQVAKMVNFGIVYGLQAKSLRQKVWDEAEIDISVEEAEAFRQAFFSLYPGIARWHEHLKRRIWDEGSIETRTLTGRRRLGIDWVNDAANSPIQGSAADGAKLAIGWLWQDRARCPTARVVNIVHDELVIECPIEEKEKVATWVKWHMEKAMTRIVNGQVPMVVDVTIAKDWAGTPLADEEG
jgi:P4 family phage/plasmid primase-like protien